MVSAAMNCASKIISLGDYNVDFFRPLPKEVDDMHVYGLENKNSDPIRFGGVMTKFSGITILVIGPHSRDRFHNSIGSEHDSR